MSAHFFMPSMIKVSLKCYNIKHEAGVYNYSLNKNIT